MVAAVETVDALDGLRTSPAVLDDLAEARDAVRAELSGVSDLDNGCSREDKDGFLNRPLTEARGLKGRGVIVFEPCFDTKIWECFSGLGVRGSTVVDKVAREDVLRSVLGAGLLAGVGVFKEAIVEVRFAGVPWTVVRGGLYVLVEARKLLKALLGGPELDPGRLRDLEERGRDPSDW